MTASHRPRRPGLQMGGVALVLLGACMADSALVWVPVGIIALGMALVLLSWMGGEVMGRCRACGAAVAWVRTARGRWMPVDARPYYVVRELPEWSGEQRAAVVTDDGDVVWGVVVGWDDDVGEAAGMAALVAGTIGRRPHWASCPDAERFRKEA